MEGRLGHGFGDVRVHTDDFAGRQAQALGASAFTIGKDVFFGSGRYQPDTADGRRLVAHELVHTVQQRDRVVSRSALGPDSVSRPSDPLELEADRIAARVVADETDAASSPVATGSADHPSIQRFELPDIDLPSLGDLERGAQSLLETGESVLQQGAQAVKDVGEAAEQAVEWIATEAGQFALAEANALAGLFGGSVAVGPGGLTITLPNVPLFDGFELPEIPLPTIGGYFPLVEIPFLIGPIPVVAHAGVRLSGEPSIVVALGPALLRGISILIDPLHGHFRGTGQLYIAAALGPRVVLRAGLGAGVTVILPTAPPIPVSLVLDGGLRWTVTAPFIGAIQETVTVEYAGGALSIDTLSSLLAGVLLQIDLNAYVSARLNDRIICEYIWPGAHWQSGAAWELALPVTASGGPGGATATVGAIRSGDSRSRIS